MRINRPEHAAVVCLALAWPALACTKAAGHRALGI